MNYSGNFEDISLRLLRTAPQGDGADTSFPMRARYVTGAYTFNQLTDRQLGITFLCMSDGDEDAKVFEYLENVKVAVTAALQGVGGGAERCRRVKLALIERLNCWASKGGAEDSNQFGNTRKLSNAGQNGNSKSHSSPGLPHRKGGHAQQAKSEGHARAKPALPRRPDQQYTRPPSPPRRNLGHQKRGYYTEAGAYLRPNRSDSNLAGTGETQAQTQEQPGGRDHRHHQWGSDGSASTMGLGNIRSAPGALDQPFSSPPATIPGSYSAARSGHQPPSFPSSPTKAQMLLEQTFSSGGSFRGTDYASQSSSAHSPGPVAHSSQPGTFLSAPTEGSSGIGYAAGTGYSAHNRHTRSSSDPETIFANLSATDKEPMPYGNFGIATPSSPVAHAPFPPNQQDRIRRTSVAEERLMRHRRETLEAQEACAGDNRGAGSRGVGLELPPPAVGVVSPTKRSKRSSTTTKGKPWLRENNRSPANRGSIGILLPMDYSGMVDGGEVGRDGEADPLLREIDGMVRKALAAQVAGCTCNDDVKTLLITFRNDLAELTLPRPTTVDYGQALKDAQREQIHLNGELFRGNVQELLESLKGLVEPLVLDPALVEPVCQDIIRASSRTASGGDTYSVMMMLLSSPIAGDLLTPIEGEVPPIGISMDGQKGEVVITVGNSFQLRKHAMMMANDVGGHTTPPYQGVAGGSTKERIKVRVSKAIDNIEKLRERSDRQLRKMYNEHKERKERWQGPGWDIEDAEGGATSGNGVSGSGAEREEGGSDTMEGEYAQGVHLNGQLEVYLSLLDGSCKRRLSISNPDVEAAPRQCIALGAGSNEVNGTYDLAAWRSGAPMYMNKNGVAIASACLGGRTGWVIGQPPGQVYYGTPEASPAPPELHWALVSGGLGINPPPTLMMNNQARGRETADIREAPTPRWNPGFFFGPGQNERGQEEADNLTTW
ncbi:unnamed protein product [Chrysoparadoxa australica]